MSSKMTVQQIADDLALNRSTVSLILNGKAKERKISLKTIQRVKEYVEEKGFYPNIGSLSMRGKYSKDIGIVSRPIPYPAQRRLFFRLVQYLEENNISFMPFYYTQERNASSAAELAQQLHLFNISRVILFGLSESQLPPEYLQALREKCAGMKFYFYNTYPGLSKAINFMNHGDVVCGSNLHKESLAVAAYAKSKGYSNVWIYGNCELETWKKMGFNAKLLKALTPATSRGIPEKDLFLIGKMLADHAVQKNMTRSVKTFFYIRNDYIAAGFIKELKLNGVKVPQDVGVASWDNLPEAAYLGDSLTSFGLPHEEITKHITDWINGKIEQAENKDFDIVCNEGNSL